MKRNLLAPLALAGSMAVAACGQMGDGGASASQTAQASGATMAPMFEVDPFWPKPLPNHWILGSAVGVGVDSRDHVFIIHRPETLNQSTEAGAATDPPTGECCAPAPYVLEFDPEGNLVNGWGGPGDGYDWPASAHGITIDPMDNVWLGGWRSEDRHVLKFTRSGEFLM